MAIDRDTMDSMLDSWAFYYLKEFSEVYYASKSITARACEALETGIISNGTRHQSNDYRQPKHIQLICDAISQMPAGQQIVIKEEYAGTGRPQQKAKRLHLSYGQYRSRLNRARSKLISLL